MIFKRQILSLLLFLPVLVFAQVTELKTEPDRLQALCTAFLNGNMDTLLLHSSPEMKQAIEDGKLALVSLQISTMFGKLRFLDGKPQKTTTVNGITIFVQTVRLERQELNCFLSIDPNGKLWRFLYPPTTKKETSRNGASSRTGENQNRNGIFFHRTGSQNRKVFLSSRHIDSPPGKCAVSCTHSDPRLGAE